MESFSSDMGSEYLVTDLVNELSSGLEIPFLLRDDILLVPKEDVFYDESFEEKCSDILNINCSSDDKNNLLIKDELDYSLCKYVQNSNLSPESLNNLSRCSNGSASSECSSTEIWMTKNDLDTPPVTPPEKRTSPENFFVLTPDEFIPIDNLSENSVVRVPVGNIKNMVSIQPKPTPEMFNFFDSQSMNCPTVVHSVFSDTNSSECNNVKRTNDLNIFRNSNISRKKSVLSKKDLELLQAKKKQERMIRNRESAYLSRKRKKEHMAHLEKQVQELVTENNHLRLENYTLRQKLAKYEEMDNIPSEKKHGVFIDSPKKATALLALMLTVCLNFGSFSSFLSETNWSNDKITNENVVPKFSNEVRYSRSLLWTDSEFNSLNTTYINLTKTSCSIYINQSESIRLESELRRWIGGDDDFSDSTNKNISKINQYFYSGEKPNVQRNFLKRRFRKRNFNLHKKNNLEVEMFKMKSNPFKFNTFFEAINRRDDTFYLVSFSGDHLLLPALSHNKTSRPKMSLMLPAFMSNVTEATSDQVEMMQIDCEVTNTQLLSVHENDIPSHMRPYSNSSSRSKGTSEAKPQKFDDLFLNDVHKKFLPAEKFRFYHREENTEIDSNATLPIDAIRKNLTKPASSKVVPFEKQEFDLIASRNVSLQEKRKYLQNFYENKFFDKTFINETIKENSVDFVTAHSKGLLKLLMIGSNISKLTHSNLKNLKKNKNNSK